MCAGVDVCWGRCVLGYVPSDTQNDLADSGEGYQNITVARQPEQPSLDFLKYLTNQIQPGDSPGDCIPHCVCGC